MNYILNTYYYFFVFVEFKKAVKLDGAHDMTHPQPPAILGRDKVIQNY